MKVSTIIADLQWGLEQTKPEGIASVRVGRREDSPRFVAWIQRTDGRIGMADVGHESLQQARGDVRVEEDAWFLMFLKRWWSRAP